VRAFLYVWLASLATEGSAKHHLSMALNLVLSVDDAMIDTDTKLRNLKPRGQALQGE